MRRFTKLALAAGFLVLGATDARAEVLLFAGESRGSAALDHGVCRLQRDGGRRHDADVHDERGEPAGADQIWHDVLDQ